MKALADVQGARAEALAEVLREAWLAFTGEIPTTALSEEATESLTAETAMTGPEQFLSHS